MSITMSSHAFLQFSTEKRQKSHVITNLWCLWHQSLVNIQFAIESGPVEIVSFPMNSMVDLWIFPYKSPFSNGFPMGFPLIAVNLSIVFRMFTRSGKSLKIAESSDHTSVISKASTWFYRWRFRNEEMRNHGMSWHMGPSRSQKNVPKNNTFYLYHLYRFI